MIYSVVSGIQQSDSAYIYTYPFFLRRLSPIGLCRILSRVPGAAQFLVLYRFWLVICFINSTYIPPAYPSLYLIPWWQLLISVDSQRLVSVLDVMKAAELLTLTPLSLGENSD